MGYSTIDKRFDTDSGIVTAFAVGSLNDSSGRRAYWVELPNGNRGYIPVEQVGNMVTDGKWQPIE